MKKIKKINNVESVKALISEFKNGGSFSPEVFENVYENLDKNDLLILCAFLINGLSNSEHVEECESIYRGIAIGLESFLKENQ